MKKQKGITLIALVITIIVMLILAGVSISMVTGENGVLIRAESAVEKNRAGEVQEAVRLAISENQIIKYSGGEKITKSQIVSELEAEGKLTAEEAELLETQDTIEIGGITIDLSNLTEGASSFLSKIDASNYGDYVNYEVDLGIATAGNTLSDNSVPTTDWRIFYKDASNVYLIASDYLQKSKFPSGVFDKTNGSYNGYWSNSDGVLTTSGNVTTNNNFLFTKLPNVTTTNLNYQAVSTLLDTNKWSGFAKTGYVDNVSTAVIGSPTVEMWMASWNERYEGETLSFDANETGYQVGLTADSLSIYIDKAYMQVKEGYNNTLYYPHKNTLESGFDTCYGYWLASPSAYNLGYVMFVDCDGYVNSSYFFYQFGGFGVRPVVSLKSGITATKDANGVWQLGE